MEELSLSLEERLDMAKKAKSKLRNAMDDLYFAYGEDESAKDFILTKETQDKLCDAIIAHISKQITNTT